MGETNQTVRTTFVWDTGSVEKGAQTVERAYDREKKAREASQKGMNNPGAGYAARDRAGLRMTPPAGSAGGGHGGSSMVQGIRDLGEGRPLNALTRFTQAAKAGGVAVAGIFTAFKIGKAAFNRVREDMDETDKAAERLNDSFLKVSKAAAFMNAGSGAEALGEQAQALREQGDSEREQQKKIGDLQTLRSSRNFGGGIVRGLDWLRSRDVMGGRQTLDQKQLQSELQARLVGAQAGKLQRDRGGALEHERDTAAERLNGSGFQASRMESEMAEKRAIADAQKLGASEKDLALIKEKFSIERERIDREEQGANIELALQGRLIAARKTGLSEVVAAEIRLQEARSAAEAAIGTQAKKAAANKVADAELALQVTTRDHALRMADLAIDRQTAQFRGNDEERAVMAADAEQANARAKWEALEFDKTATIEQKKQAFIALEQANTARVLLERQQKVARIMAGAQDRANRIGLGAAGAGLGAGGTVGQRAALQGDVQIARELLVAAEKRAIEERGSLASIQAQKQAAYDLAKAELNLQRHVIETSRLRKLEIGNLETNTAAMRLQNVGRGDKAQLLTSRRQSSVAQYEALRDGNPDLARALAGEQQERETGMALQKYYRPDGRRRSRSQINREERIARRTEGRLSRAAGRLAANGGMMDVRRDINGRILSGRDPITRERVTAEQMYARKNAPRLEAARDKAQGEKSFKDIWQLLFERLPKNVTK